MSKTFLSVVLLLLVSCLPCFCFNQDNLRANLESQFQELKKSIKELQEILLDYQEIILNLETQLETLKKLHSKDMTNIKKLESLLKSYKGIEKNLKEELKESTKELLNLKKQLSTSWIWYLISFIAGIVGGIIISQSI